MRKICAVTGSRSDYGLLFILLKELQVDPAIDFRLVITGSHLSPSHGLTYREIEQDGFIISDRVDMLLSTDSRIPSPSEGHIHPTLVNSELRRARENPAWR